MTASSLRDSVTPREHAAGLIASMRPMDSADARMVTGPVGAGVARIERGSEENVPAA